MIPDNDIKKALECCKQGTAVDCKECPLYEDKGHTCITILSYKSLDLINRKDAEIEKLNVELVGMRGACESYKMHYDKAQTEIERLDKLVIYNASCCTRLHKDLFNAKSEAIKEFTERFKDKYKKPYFYLGSYEQFMREVDNLVKEMTEVQE